MKRNLLILLVALVAGFATSCKKDQADVNPNQEVMVTFGLDIMEQVENFGLKSGSMPEWTHPLNTITVVMTNLDNDDVFTDTFTDINAMTMVVPSGNYNVVVSNPVPGIKASYMHFTAEKNVIVTEDGTIILHADLYQSLVTVSNALVTPKVNNTDMYMDQGMYYMYIINWDGEWKYDGKKIHTSVTPETGKRYHFTITENGIIVEGIGDWENGNKTFVDRIVAEDLFDANNPNGFLFTADPTQNLWKWTRDNTQGYANIANPIAVSLYKAGYEEAALVGFESIYNFLNNQYMNGSTDFSSAAMYGLLVGYEATGNMDYFNLAADFMADFMAKYPSDGSGSRPREMYWGYDFLNLLYSAQIADAHGLTGAQAYYNEWKATYLADYEAYATDEYHRIFTNVIFTGMGIGTHQGEVDWNGIVAANNADGYLSLQEGAYVLMGNSYSDASEVKSYLLGNLQNAVYSEPLAEAVLALGDGILVD